MKKMVYVLLAGTILTIGACGNNEDEQTNDNQSQPNDSEEVSAVPEDLSSTLEDVIKSAEELNAAAVNSPDDTDKINEKGNELEENWDKIEKQVEEDDPEIYTDIENSLYPLKHEAKKEKPDMQKIRQLSEETKKKVTAYHKKIQS